MSVVKVVVVQRQTNVADKPIPSRSVYARLLESMEYLQEGERITLEVADEGAFDLVSRNFDVLVFCKHSSPVSIKLARRAREMGKRVIYDIDDFLPAFPAYSGGTNLNRKLDGIRAHIEAASVVTTATEFLKEQIDRYFGIKSVLVPNGFNVERHYKYKTDVEEARIIFTNADLIKVNQFKDGFFRSMNRVLNANPETTFDIISDPNDELGRFVRGNKLGNMAWFDHKKELASRGYNIGVVPLGGYDDSDALLFNSCKSPIKYLEYGGLKIAGVYSKSPIYEQVVTNMETGILIENSEDDWFAALELLIHDKKTRSRIADNAFEDIKAKHHVSTSAKVWEEVLGC